MILAVACARSFCGHFAPRTVFSGGFQALMPYIMASMDQRDSKVAPQSQFIKVVVIPVDTLRLIPTVLSTEPLLLKPFFL